MRVLKRLMKLKRSTLTDNRFNSDYLIRLFKSLLECESLETIHVCHEDELSSTYVVSMNPILTEHFSLSII